MPQAYRGRSSAQRRLIAETADAMPCGFTADELIRVVRRYAPGVGAATVYRALGAMGDAGFVEVVDTRDGAAVYARCRSAGHHHHVVCVSCGAVAETSCEFDAILQRLEESSGYRLTSHELALHGVCPACRKKGA